MNGVCRNYILTYKLSQDHIEMIFGIVRRRGGWSNNPRTMQFCFAYRAILSKLGVLASANGNMCPLDITDDLVDLEDIMNEEWVDTEARPVDESYISRLPNSVHLLTMFTVILLGLLCAVCGQRLNVQIAVLC